MKKLTMLLIGGIGCCMVTDISAMMMVKKVRGISQKRWCSDDFFKVSFPTIPECIQCVQISNEYLSDWHKGKIRKLQQKKLSIIKDSLHLDVADYDHHDEAVFKATTDLTKYDLDISRNIKMIMQLEKENRNLEKRYQEWKRN